MGFTPAQVEAMSLWQFAACVEGWNRANGGEAKPDPMSDYEFDDMKRRLM